MRKLTVFGTFIVLAVLLAVTVSARGFGSGGGKNFPVPNPKFFAEELKLDEKQFTELDNAYNQLRRSQVESHAQQQLLRMDLADELGKEKPDKSKIDGLIDKLSANHSNMLKERTGYIIKMKSVLSPEQVSKLEQMRQERRDERRDDRRVGRRNRGWGQGYGEGRGPWCPYGMPDDAGLPDLPDGPADEELPPPDME